MDMASIRQASWRIATNIGYPKNERLPLLEDMSISRPKSDVVSRVFAICCVAASAYGHDRMKALSWLAREGAIRFLTQPEREFLYGAQVNAAPFMDQIEGMWALSWCLQIVPELDFSKPCANDFVKLLPNLKKDEPGLAFTARASLRNSEDVVTKCDLAYCLHWGVVQAGLTGTLPTAIRPYIIIERRRALEWILSDESWDELALDT